MIALHPLRSAGAILCFHGITSQASPSRSDVHVPLGAFQSLIAAARQMGQLVRLRDLVRRNLAGRSTAGLIAVTVDDAYASVLSEAADYLRREAIPLTAFVVTEAAHTGAAYWWDRIDDLFPWVPAERWRALEDACGLPEDYRKGQPARYGPLRPLRQWLLATHKGRWPEEREALLASLEEEAGVRTRQRSMTFEELARLAAIPSVDLGVHTVSHSVLPLLPDAELTREISSGYVTLRERFANAVQILAVPFGLFDRRTVNAAREAGMMASLTLAGTTLKRHGGRDDLPRFCISRDDTAWKLKLRLADALDWVNVWRRTLSPRYPPLPSPTT